MKTRPWTSAVLLWVAAALVFSVSPLGAQDAAHPQARLVKVEQLDAAEGGWIRSETEITALFPLPLERIAEVLKDYPSYPNFLPHLKRTVVSPGAGGATRIRQSYEVSVLGYLYRTEYTLDIRVDDSVPGRWVQSWTLVDSDGSLGAADGSWSLEAEDQGRATRVTHRNTSLVKSRFPFQAGFMRAVAVKELGAALTALQEETQRRVAGNSRLP